MAKAKQNIAARVRELVEGTVTGLGYELWDVEYVKDGAFWYLRITIDSDKGIFIEDCERVHRAIDPIIDEADPIEDQYYLEVSSPGIERELRTSEHMQRYIGSEVNVMLYTAIDGKKQLRGTLKSFDADTVTVGCDGKDIGADKRIISRVTLYYDFDNAQEFDNMEEEE